MPQSLVLPSEVATLLASTRRSAGLTLEELAATSDVPVAVVAELEAGTSTLEDPLHLLETLEKLARGLGQPPEVVISPTLQMWSSAYSREQPLEDKQRTETETTPEAADTPTAPLPVFEGHSVGLAGRAPLESSSTRSPGPPEDPPRSTLAVTAEPTTKGERAVLRASVVATVVLAVAIGALIVAQAGLLRSTGKHSPAPTTRTPAVRGPDLLTQTSAGTQQANYTVSASTYHLEVRADRPSWVSIGPTAGPPAFSGIVRPGQARSFTETGPVTLEVGAGGTKVSVKSGAQTQILEPPAAPYTYEFSTEG